MVVNRRYDVGLRPTWRDVGPCRVRLASLMVGAIFQLFLPDEEQFANLQLWKNVLLHVSQECSPSRVLIGQDHVVVDVTTWLQRSHSPPSIGRLRRSVSYGVLISCRVT